MSDDLTILTRRLVNHCLGRCDRIWNHSIFSLFYAQPTFRCTHSTRLRTHAMRSPFYAQSRSGPATQSCFRFALARIVRMMIRTATTTAIRRTKYQPTITISYNSRHHEQLQEDGRKGAPVAEHCGRLGATLSAGRGMVAPNTTAGAGLAHLGDVDGRGAARATSHGAAGAVAGPRRRLDLRSLRIAPHRRPARGGGGSAQRRWCSGECVCWTDELCAGGTRF